MLNKIRSILLYRNQNPIYGDVLISHRYHFLLYTNAKCGSGTAKEWFLYQHNVISDQQICSGVDQSLGKSVHEYVRDPKTCCCLTEKDLLRSIRRYAKIIVVRNPWKRVVSFYTDKILIQKNWLPWLNLQTRENYSKDITFREFVQCIKQIPDIALEGHLRSQNYSRENINFDFVVKLENFNAEIASVAATLNLPKLSPPQIHRNKTPYSAGFMNTHIPDLKPREINSIPPYQLFYDEELLEIIGEKYKSDIERFNSKFKD